jgi:hypothetical protein
MYNGPVYIRETDIACRVKNIVIMVEVSNEKPANLLLQCLL